jgi:hypothetical protein
MKPSYMAIEKALYVRQPDSFYFFGFVFFALEESILFCVVFLYPCCRKRVCFSVSTVA